MENYTEIQKDLQVILDLFDDIEFSDLCWKLDLSEERYNELLNGEGAEPTKQELENIYNFAYNRGLYLNEITWQECLDEYRNETINLGTHGSRTMIRGDIRLDVNTESNDFSTGFYVGEDISQAGMFVCEEPNASLYFLTFDTEGLNKCLFNVSTDWMLAICWFRDRLAGYENHSRIKAIRERVAECDYVVAPIADNKIFDLMDAFAAGEITDMQCLYALSATHLGYQYVMKTQKAVDHLNIIKHLYYCATEKSLYAKESDIESNTSMNKALIAKKRYGDQGKYINELLGDIIVDESLKLKSSLKPRKKKKKQKELPPNGLTPIMPDPAAGTDTFNKNMGVSTEGGVSGDCGGE